jgi:hypothetical protein
MAVVFQFHRINQHPLHLSYITFALIAIMTLPSPNEISEDNGRHCFDLGKINADASVSNKWNVMNHLKSAKNTNNTSYIHKNDTEKRLKIKPRYEGC